MKRGTMQTPKEKRAMPKTKPSPELYNKALTDAIGSIYSVYGSNLAAFFRDVEDPVTHGNRKIKLHGHFVQTASDKRYRVNSLR